MARNTLHKRENLFDIQKRMSASGELINGQNTVTKAETVFGKALIDAGIQVVPQFEVEGRSFDFKLFHYSILIEIDGSIHSTSKKRSNDARKTRFVVRRGYKVLRFTNFEVMSEKYLKRCIGEVRSTMRYYGKQPKEIFLYPLSLFEQIKLWILKLRGKEWEHCVKIEFKK